MSNLIGLVYFMFGIATGIVFSVIVESLGYPRKRTSDDSDEDRMAGQY